MYSFHSDDFICIKEGLFFNTVLFIDVVKESGELLSTSIFKKNKLFNFQWGRELVNENKPYLRLSSRKIPKTKERLFEKCLIELEREALLLGYTDFCDEREKLYYGLGYRPEDRE